MCFSATASFVVGSALSAVGVATIIKAKRKSTDATALADKAEVPFAIIPLLFGIQQLTEGLIWLSFRFNVLLLNTISTPVYSLFAYVFWPIYVPFAVQSLETVLWRKKLLFLFQLIGIAVGAYLLYFHIQVPVTSQVINKSIVYATPHFYDFWVPVFYFSATCVSAFLSSHKLINLLGVLVFIGAVVSYQFYTISFVSVWCFFAAIFSGIIYWFI